MWYSLVVPVPGNVRGIAAGKGDEGGGGDGSAAAKGTITCCNFVIPCGLVFEFFDHLELGGLWKRRRVCAKQGAA